MAEKTKKIPSRPILQAENIHLLSDGTVGKIINRQLERLYADLETRGDDKEERTLTIELGLRQSKDGTRIRIIPSIKGKVPTYKPSETIAKLDDKAGGLLFNPDLAESPDQLTLNDEAEAES